MLLGIMDAYKAKILFKHLQHIRMDKQEERFNARAHKDANKERMANRQKRFQQFRKAKTELNPSYQQAKMIEEFDEFDYFKNYNQQQKKAIKLSLTGVVPTQLPPISPDSISFYRRADRKVFQTKLIRNGPLDPHMTYQSLNMLHESTQKEYANYPAVIKQFQSDFRSYLKMDSQDIRVMAVTAAGNRVLGRQKDILALAGQSSEYVWVLCNHIIEDKISFRHLFPLIAQGISFAYKVLYLLSNICKHQCLPALMDCDQALDALLVGLQGKNTQIRNECILIIGNACTQGQEYLSVFQRMKLLDKIYGLMRCPQWRVRRDVCWMLVNFSTSSSPATALARHRDIMPLLANMLSPDSSEFRLQVKAQIAKVFNNLTTYADKKLVFQTFGVMELIEICIRNLENREQDLILYSLGIIYNLVEMGEEFTNEEGINQVMMMANRSQQLKVKLEQLKISQNYEIAGSCFELSDLLAKGNQMQSQSLMPL